MYKKPSHTNNIHKKPSHTNNSCEKPSHISILVKNHYTNIMRINIFAIINQINKHKTKMYDQCMYTQLLFKNFMIIYKKNSPHKYKENFLFGKYKDDKFII